MKTTILTANDGKLLTKRFTDTPAGWSVEAYGKAYTYDVTTHDVHNISDLSAMLTMLETMSNSCIIRGALKPGFPTLGVKRRILDQNGEKAAFEEVASGLTWVMIDYDKVPAPSANMTQEERLDHLVSLLPPAFHDVTYHYQWSSSSGLYGWDVLSCHLWYWLDRPHRCGRLRDQINAENWEIDESLINAAQIHYTASPIFTNAVDPMGGCRSGTRPTLWRRRNSSRSPYRAASQNSKEAWERSFWCAPRAGLI